MESNTHCLRPPLVLGQGLTRPPVRASQLPALLAATLLSATLATSAQAQSPTPATEAPAAGVPAAGSATVRNWDLPNQPLGSALARIASDSGQQISIDAGLVQGLTAPAVRGELTAEQAARAALSGSGLGLVRNDAGHWTLRRLPPTSTGPGVGANAAAGGAAAGAAATTALPTVQVRSQLERSEVSEGSGSYTVNSATVGGRLGESLREVPRSISVITRQQLDDQRVLNLSEAVQQLPGVTTSFSSGNSEEITYYSRGNVLDSITADGLAIAPRSASSGDTRGGGSNLGMAKYDSIQLLRGPDALFSGNGSPSGTINLVRKHPTESFQARAAMSVGSWDNYALEMDLSSPLTEDGRVRGRVVAARNESHHFYSAKASRKSTFYGIIDADLTPDTLLTVGASRDTVHGAPDQPPDFPRYNTGQQLNVDRRTGYPDWAQRNYDINNVFASIEHRFNADWRLKAGFSNTRTLRGINQMTFYGSAADPLTDTTSGGVGASRADWHRDLTAVDVHLNGAFRALDRDHQFMVGTDYSDAEQYSMIGGLSSSDPIRRTVIYWPTFDPNTAIPAWTNDPGWDNTSRYRQSGIYSYGRFQIQGPVKLILGGRYASYSAWTSGWNAYPDAATGQCPSWATTCNAPVNVKYQDKSGIFTPYYALTWDVASQWTSYLSMASSFEDQTDKLSATMRPLDPTRGRSWELGLKGSPFGGRLNANIALYRSVRDNYAVLVGRADEFAPAGRSCCYAGTGKFMARGIELGLSGALTPNWQVNAGYTFDDNKTEYGDDNGQRFASYTPKHILRIWTSYRLSGRAHGFRLGGGVQAQSSFFNSGTVNTWNDATNRYDGPSVPYQFTEPGRAIWNAFGEYRFNRHLTASLNAYNLFNKRYLAVAGDTNGGNYYGAPRSLMLTMRGEY